MNFAGIIGDDRPDGLLGTATGHFDRKKHLVGVSDIFDFDDKPRGHSANPLTQALYVLEGKAVGPVQNDADTFCPRGSNPVRVAGGRR